MSRLIIDTPPAFQFRATLLSHGWLELKPFEHNEDYTELSRVEQLSDGTVVRLRVTSTAEEALRVDAEGGPLTTAQEAELRRVVGRIFSLDLDLAAFYDRLDGLKRYAWVRKHGAGRLLRSPTVWEDLAKTLLTTNTTWSMTKSMVARLTELGAAFDGGGHAFPRPERIAAMGLTELAEHVRAGYRNAYLHELAETIAAGKIDVESWDDAEIPSAALFEEVRKLKGFGPYAAGAVLKLLGHYDELALDSAARSMFRRELHESEAPQDAAIKEHYERYGEWKGLVIWMDLMREWFLEQHRRAGLDN